MRWLRMKPSNIAELDEEKNYHEAMRRRRLSERGHLSHELESVAEDESDEERDPTLSQLSMPPLRRRRQDASNEADQMSINGG